MPKLLHWVGLGSRGGCDTDSSSVSWGGGLIAAWRWSEGGSVGMWQNIKVGADLLLRWVDRGGIVAMLLAMVGRDLLRYWGGSGGG